MKMGVFKRLTAASLYLAIFALPGLLWAQDKSPLSTDSKVNVSETIMVAERGAYSMAGLINHRGDAGAFRHGVVLFAGHPGILNLREEAGQPVFDLRGNFLIRSRRHWLDNETLILVIDAPSDQRGSFSQAFRQTSRYGEDVAALLGLVGQRYGISQWTAVGTSEGSVSAFHAARMNPELIRRVILTASVFSASRNGPGLSEVNWSALEQPLLLMHHVDDPCKFTMYRTAEDIAVRISVPLVTVRGGKGARGPACEAYTAHGFVGAEAAVVAAMLSWLKNGVVPGDVVVEQSPGS